MLPATRLSARRGYAVLPTSRSPLLTSITRPQPPSAPLAPKQVSKSSAGLTVATLDLPGPASSVAVVLRAGSRYEPGDAPGVSHYLKDYAFRVGSCLARVSSLVSRVDRSNQRLNY